MFSERRYASHNNDYDRRPTSALVWLLCALVAGFIIQSIFENLIPGAAVLPVEVAAFTPAALREMHLWTVFTYALLHDGLLHLVVNGLVIYFMGREVLPMLGNKRFALVSLCAAAGGALLWFAVNFRAAHTPLIGSSAIALALLVLFACFNPNSRVTVLLFFIIPVSIRPKYIAAIAVALDLFGLVFFEIPGRQGALSVAYSAHIGGMAVAFAYYFLIYRREWRNPDGGGAGVIPDLFRKKKKPAAVVTPNYKVNITSRDDLRAEVDRVLDKINSQGFASLSDEEKRILDSAKDMLSGR